MPDAKRQVRARPKTKVTAEPTPEPAKARGSLTAARATIIAAWIALAGTLGVPLLGLLGNLVPPIQFASVSKEAAALRGRWTHSGMPCAYAAEFVPSEKDIRAFTSAVPGSLEQPTQKVFVYELLRLDGPGIVTGMDCQRRWLFLRSCRSLVVFLPQGEDHLLLAYPDHTVPWTRCKRT